MEDKLNSITASSLVGNDSEANLQSLQSRSRNCEEPNSVPKVARDCPRHSQESADNEISDGSEITSENDLDSDDESVVIDDSCFTFEYGYSPPPYIYDSDGEIIDYIEPEPGMFIVA